MSRMRHSKPLQLLGLLSSMWLVLAGCGGQSDSDGSGGGGGSAPRVRHITLQLTRSTEVVSTARNQESASAQVRAVQRGTPAFIERFEIRVQTPQGVDLLSLQEFALGPADQETVALDVIIPEPSPAEFQILVSAFNNFNDRQTKIFLGQVLIQRGQDSATLMLVRNPDPTTFIPVPATPASLQQTVFPFTDGAVFGFGLGGQPATLAAGSFRGNTGDFTLTSGGFVSGGQVTIGSATIGSCDFLVTVSTFPPGLGPHVGDRITFDPCEQDAVDKRLMATNASLGIKATSEAPIAASRTINDPPVANAQSVTTPEDTPKVIGLTGSDVETPPANLTFTLATPPAHGSLTGTPPTVTYTPAAHYHGPDSFTFTVTDRGAPDNCGAPGPSCAAPRTSALAKVSITVTPAAVGVGMVVDNSTKAVIVFDATTDTVLGAVPIATVGLTRGDCSITADGTRGFATDFAAKIWVIDLTTSPPSLVPDPISIANHGEDTSISPDGKFLVVCDGGGSEPEPVSVIDIATQKQISTFSVGSDCNSVEVLSDGSVLTTSFNTDKVHRLTIDSTGYLTDTGESLPIADPMNVYGAPDATSGFVVSFSSRSIRSFTIPGLKRVDTRRLSPGSGGGLSGLVHPAGNQVYVRSVNGVDVFAYNSATGALGSTPLFSIPTASARAFFGMDQMAITPDGTKLYVSQRSTIESQPSTLDVYDASTGHLLTSIKHAAIVEPTGVCFATLGAQ